MIFSLTNKYNSTRILHFQGIFKTSNQFSSHANRHSLQDHAVYFGNVSKWINLYRLLFVQYTTKLELNNIFELHHVSLYSYNLC